MPAIDRQEVIDRAHDVELLMKSFKRIDDPKIRYFLSMLVDSIADESAEARFGRTAKRTPGHDSGAKGKQA